MSAKATAVFDVMSLKCWRCGGSRFRRRVRRSLDFLNTKAGRNDRFVEWVCDHACLYACMQCQAICIPGYDESPSDVFEKLNEQANS